MFSEHALKTQKIDLQQFEKDIAERLFRLFEMAARMGVTSQAPCYNKNIISQGFIPMLELMEMIMNKVIKEK